MDANMDSNIDDIDLSDEEEDDEDDEEEEANDGDEPDNSTASGNDQTTVVKKVEDAIDINKMTVTQLKAQCKKENLTGYKKMKKQSLIDLLTKNTINHVAN